MESTLGSLSPVNHQSVSSAHEEQFTVNHVNDIRAACVCLLDAVANIISVRHHESLPSYRTLTQNMVSMNDALFRGVRDRYLWWSAAYPSSKTRKNINRIGRTNRASIRASSVNDTTSRHSHYELAKLLDCLTSAFDSCMSALIQCLKRRSNSEVVLHERLHKSQEQTAFLKTKLDLTQRKLEDCQQEKEIWISRFEELEQNAKKAEEKVLTLEKRSSAITWQNELDKINKIHNCENQEFQEKIDTLAKQRSQTVKEMAEKMRKMEEKIGKLKVKNETTTSQSSLDLYEKLQHLKREVHMRDENIGKLKKEIHAQRQLITGCLNGLETDFVALLEKWEAKYPGRKFKPDEEWIKFQAILRCVHDSWSNDTLDSLHHSLPSHYALSETHASKMTQMSRSAWMNQTKQVDREEMVVPYENKTKDICFTNAAADQHLSSNAIIAHPQLVSRATGRVDMVQVMKNFPYLTVEQVLKQWENFKKYDKNNDFTLDLPELYEMVQDVCRINVTPQQMREAMQEVDRDKSNNIDFYEYLKVSEMLMLKQGSTYVFKASAMEENNFSAYEACVVQ